MNHSEFTPIPLHWLHDVVVPVLRQETRRIRSSIGIIVTTSFATIVTSWLFIYIFGDFIKTKVSAISPDASKVALDTFTCLFVIVSSIGITRWLRELLYSRHGWLAFIKALGFKNAVVTKSSTLTSLAAFGVVMALALWLWGQFIAPIRVWHQYLAAVIAIISSMYQIRSAPKNLRSTQEQCHSCQSNIAEPLVAWRQTRVATGGWPGSSLRFFAAVPMVLTPVSITLGHPTEFSQLCTLTGGIILAWTTCFLISEDIKTSWIEKQMAVGHKQWIDAWQVIFYSWAKPLFWTNFVLFALATAVSHGTAIDGMNQAYLVLKNSLVNGVLAAFPTWIAPAFLLQIDARRVLTNIMMLTLINVFLGSVIVIFPLSTPALYLLKREAHNYQEGRFARGSQS